MIEYALGQLLAQWGVRPQALIGHSLGEYSAACVASVFSFEDGLRLLVHRAKRIEMLPAGGMVGVAVEESEVAPLLDDELYVAAINGVQALVISGTNEGIERLQNRLLEQRIAFRRLPATHAFHSPLISAASDELIERFADMNLQRPSVPLVSCATGRWISNEEVTDPRYWATQMCNPVRFSQGLDCLLRDGNHFFLEVGPGDSLASLARQHPACTRERLHLIQNMMRTTHEQGNDVENLLHAMGRLWIGGAALDGKAFYQDQRRQQVALPTSRTEPESSATEATPTQPPAQPTPSDRAVAAPVADAKRDPSDWCSVRGWKPTAWYPSDETDQRQNTCYLLLADDSGTAQQLGGVLSERGIKVVCAEAGESYEQNGDDSFTVCPTSQADYLQLFQQLSESDRSVTKIVHLGALSERDPGDRGNVSKMAADLQHRFDSLLVLVQTLDLVESPPFEIVVITRLARRDRVGTNAPA